MDTSSLPNGIEFIQSTNFKRIRNKRTYCSTNDKVITRRNRKKKPDIQLEQEVEADEVYIVAGHKGQPENVVKAKRPARPRRLKGARGRGTLATEKPPVLGLVQRNGQLVVRLLANVKQKTIQPIIEQIVAKGSLIYNDEYNIYNRLQQWGYDHKTVCHSKGEYARDDDGDGFCEVHVNTQEGIWSVLRSWLRPHRGISQKRLPIYLGFFEFIFNWRRCDIFST